MRIEEEIEGMSEIKAEILWGKIEKNASYQFNLSHAAAYTVISYWAMWLKVHHPLEFFGASMSILKDEKMAALLKDANDHGIEVYPPNINFSSNKFEIGKTIEGKDALTIPFNRIKGISDNTGNAIVEARKKNGGSFSSREELASMLTGRQYSSRASSALDRVGAFALIEEGSLPPNHPDRLKDQMELMPELCSGYIYVSRQIDRSPTTSAALGTLYGRMKDCTDCSLSGGVHPLPTFGKKAEFMVITDCPNKDEDSNNKMFKGSGSGFIKSGIAAAGLKSNQGYYTALVKSQKIGNMLTNEQINGCSRHIDEEIKITKPAVIVLMGSAVIKHFLPSEKKPREAMGKVVYSAELDANLAIGMNPAVIWFNPDKQDDLDAIFMKVADIL